MVSISFFLSVVGFVFFFSPRRGGWGGGEPPPPPILSPSSSLALLFQFLESSGGRGETMLDKERLGGFQPGNGVLTWLVKVGFWHIDSKGTFSSLSSRA